MVSLGTLTMLAALAAPAPDQPVLLDFTATWCEPCRLMEPTVARLQREGYRVEKVDFDQQRQVAAQYGVRQIPCFVMLAGGREIDRVVGPASFDRLQRMFRAAAEATRNTAAPAGAVAPRGFRDWPAQDATEPMSSRPPATPPRAPSSAPNSTSAPPRNGSRRPPSELALAATVRLTVEDHTYKSYGTGTIIDIHGNEVLVLTCGHIFRASGGRGPIHVDLFSSDGRHTTLSGRLLELNLKQDLALVTFRPGRAINKMRVASAAYQPRPRERVFTVGCGHGGPPRVEESQITTINRYTGPGNIEVAGQPVSGRSGGGLFTTDGRLIGVCNARDREDDEGIYASLSEVQAMLARIGLQHVYDRPTEAIADTRSPAPPVTPPAREVTPPVPPRDNPARFERLTRNEQALVDALKRHGDDAEIICIVRSRSEPPTKSELIVLENPSNGFLSHLSSEFVAQQNDARRTTSLERTTLPTRLAVPQETDSSSRRQAAMEWHARQP